MRELISRNEFLELVKAIAPQDVERVQSIKPDPSLKYWSLGIDDQGCITPPVVKKYGVEVYRLFINDILPQYKFLDRCNAGQEDSDSDFLYHYQVSKRDYARVKSLYSFYRIPVVYEYSVYGPGCYFPVYFDEVRWEVREEEA